MPTTTHKKVFCTILLLYGLCFLSCFSVAAKERDSFTDAYDRYLRYGDQSTISWAEIRQPEMQKENLSSYITHIIQQKRCGYIAYPVCMGNVFRFINDPEAQKVVRHMGYLQIPPSSLPAAVEQCSYTPWLFGNELLDTNKDAANKTNLDRFFSMVRNEIKVTRALWYYFSPNEPEKRLPPPSAANLFFFLGKDGDYDAIQALLSSNRQGYIICPVWTEDITGALDNQENYPTIRGNGSIEFLLASEEQPLSFGLNITLWKEDAAKLRKTDIVPFTLITDSSRVIQNWLLSVPNLRPETIRSFYCYFDTRKEEEMLADQQAGNCSVPVFAADGFTSESDSLNACITRYHTSRASTIIPYWMEDIYQKLPDSTAARIPRLAYAGYIIDPVTGIPHTRGNWRKENLVDFSPFTKTPFDLMVVFRGKEGVYNFLRSKAAQVNLIKSIFDTETGLINRAPSLRKAQGLNFYFPDYNFKEKKQFVQFIKSISFVIDSFCVEQKKIYSNLDLSLTFPIHAKNEINFLSIFLKYRLTDRLCFVDYDKYGVPVTESQNPNQPNAPYEKMVIYESGYETSSFLWNFINSFYLMDTNLFDQNTIQCTDNFEELANTQFANPMLIYFLIGLLVLIFMLLLLLTLYYTYSKFYMFARHNYRYIAPVIITLITEIVMVIICIANIISTRETYGMWKQLFLLAMPVVSILLFDVIPKLINKKEPLP